MALAELWSQAEALRRQLAAATAPAAGLAAAPFGLNVPGVALLLRARQAAPEPISASRLGGWNPGVNPWTYEAGLQHLTAQGLLAGEAGGAYALTPAGQSALELILSAVAARLAALAPAEMPTLAPLAHRLQSLVDASLAAPQPPRQTRLRLSQRLALDASAPALVRVDAALAGLAAYHADCHEAAWQPHMVSGPAWDVFTALWRGTLGTVDDIYGQLAGRGWPRDTYVRALQELVRQNWIAGPEPYALTPLGRAIFERAVAQTHRDFFAPWQGLDAHERDDLEKMLTLLTETIRAT